MDTARMSSLCGLPTEIGQHISEMLDTDSLKSFRQTCRPLAQVGLRSLESRVPGEIEYRPAEDENATSFIHSLVLGLQAGLPKAAGQVTRLEIELHYRPHQHLPESLGAVRLPGLRELTLIGVTVPIKSLRAILRKHKNTLKELALTDVALDLPDAGTAGIRRKLDSWTTLMDYVRRKMEVEETCMTNLTWCDAVSGEACGEYMQTTMGKFHPRYLDSEGWERFRIGMGGLEASGLNGVRLELSNLIEKMDRTVLDRPR